MLPRRSSFFAPGLALALTLAPGCSGKEPAPIHLPVTPIALVAPTPLASGRLPATTRPLKYDLSLVVDPAAERFTGDVTIAVDVTEPTHALVLHGRDLTILRAEVTAGGPPIAATTSFRPAAGSKSGADELVLLLPRKIPAGRAAIRISYSARVGDKLIGLYRVTEDDVPYVFTQFEPADARRAFPCFDEPGFKAPLELKVTAPKGNLVIANTEERDRSVLEDGRNVTFRFAPTAPLPTYLYAFAVGPFEVKQGRGAPTDLRVVTTKGRSLLAEPAAEAAAAHLRLLEGYFDRAYPYSKLDLVAVPEFGFGAMENAGLVTFRDDILLVDRDAGAEARRDMALTIAHELAHHWFGDLVTMAWWDDLWLNEGFATWMERRIVDQWWPAMEARLDAVRAKGEVMQLDALATARAVRQPVSTTGEAEEAFDGITYDKGASVLGMLEAWLGPDVFRNGVRKYIAAHAHGSATSKDLFEALSAASGKDVWKVASAFLDQPGVPLVRAELACDDGGARVKLAKERYRVAGTKGAKDDAPWTIPVCVSYEGADGGAPACGLLDGATGEIPLPTKRCPRFVYPNTNEEGYYHFALPPAQMNALAAAGNALDVRARVGLLMNGWALVKSGDLGADALLDLFAGLGRERHRLVVEQMIAALRSVQGALIDDAARPAFRAWVSSLLLPLGRELGWDPKPNEGDDQKLLREEVLTALTTLAEDPWAMNEAKRRAGAFLANPKLDGGTAAIALRAASRRAGADRFDALLTLAKTSKTPEVRGLAWSALGSFEDDKLLRRALDATLDDEVRYQDVFAAFDAALAWPGSRPIAIAWMKQRFGDLKKKVPAYGVVRFAAETVSACDPAARDEAARFLGEALAGVDGAERARAQTLEAIEQCIAFKGREAEKVKKRLAGGRGAAPKR